MKYLPLWKQACDIIDQQLASRPLGEWITLQQSFQWKSTDDDRFLTDGVDIYKCERAGRRQ